MAPSDSPTDPGSTRGSSADADAGPARLPDGCGTDGRVIGSRAALLVDPADPVDSATLATSAALADATDPPDLPVHVVCTDGAALAALRGSRPAAGGTLYLRADSSSMPARTDETVHGWPVRRVHTAATVDLGGLVADVVHLGAAHGPDDLVVSVRAVDERGRPRREVPPIVYTGLMVNDADIDNPDRPFVDDEPRPDAQMRAWADSLDLVCGLLGGNGLAVTRAGTVHTYAQVDAQRVARLQAAGTSGTGRVGMPPPDWQLPLA